MPAHTHVSTPAGEAAAMDDFDPVPPAIGTWYRDITGAVFEVVALDEDDRTVEIQYLDGSLEEIDLDVWTEMPLVMIEPPEDWMGSLDIEREDLGIDPGELPVETWASPIDYIDRAE